MLHEESRVLFAFFSLPNLIKWYGWFFPPPSNSWFLSLGGWVEDQRCGFGKYYYINGDTYEGEWQNHVRHGRGTYTYSLTGTKYTGMWNTGKWEGHGELIHANHKYVGIFKSNRVSLQLLFNSWTELFVNFLRTVVLLFKYNWLNQISNVDFHYDYLNVLLFL